MIGEFKIHKLAVKWESRINWFLMLIVNIFYHKHTFCIEKIKEIKIINLYFPVFPTLVKNSSIDRDGKYRYLPPVIPSTGISRPTLLESTLNNC